MNTHISIHKKAYAVDSCGVFTPVEDRELSAWMKGMAVNQASALNHVSPDTVKTHTAFHLYSQHRMPGIGSFDFGGLSHGRI